jgi:site-specific recombinase XerC
MSSSSLPSLIQRFFTDRLLVQLGASPHTVAAYRDAFRMLFQFAAETLRDFTTEPAEADVRQCRHRSYGTATRIYGIRPSGVDFSNY